MDNTFRDRVDKIFGSLTSSSPSKPQPSSSLKSSLWSLTDDAVERKEWKRDTSSLAASFDRDEIPCASESNRSRRGGEYDLEDWGIRSSIGLDPTLDNEEGWKAISRCRSVGVMEEEDEYDKVAEGRENAGERLYMKDVTDQGSFLNFYNVVSKSLHGTRDPRANHLAAKIRLQEDRVEAQTENSHNDFDKATKVSNECSSGQLKSILKRKQNNSDFKSCKRVRFDPGCRAVHKEDASEEIQDISMTASSANDLISEDGSIAVQNALGVPDYLRNPSKYTRYSFDSSTEVDEKSDTQSYNDFLKSVKCSKSTDSGSELEDASSDIPKVTFIPKKLADEVKAISSDCMVKQDKGHNDDHYVHATNFLVGIAAGESQESEAGAVEENEPERNVADRNTGFQKPGRRYRTKSSLDDFDP
ncbi:unnamed protein product [Dovyalis caffra]|uniref:Protein TSSC4 n=1 Tax=Dovyalis caffra TaxID=77055 RepID=A0AAV1RI00_9ROSI|nr:unnamed protein product [Dovyalis caffra]